MQACHILSKIFWPCYMYKYWRDAFDQKVKALFLKRAVKFTVDKEGSKGHVFKNNTTLYNISTVYICTFCYSDTRSDGITGLVIGVTFVCFLICITELKIILIRRIICRCPILRFVQRGFSQIVEIVFWSMSSEVL